MREVVRDHLQARVPTCPDWTVDDLTWHLGMVYLYKAAGIREGATPRSGRRRMTRMTRRSS
jgi:hypothetical protein